MIVSWCFLHYFPSLKVFIYYILSNFAKTFFFCNINYKPPSAQERFRREASPLTEKMKEMQKFFGLKVSGKLDKETMEMMKKPRCGGPDVAAYSTFGGKPKWQTNKLTYRIVNYTPDMSKAEVDESMEKALQVWANVTPLRFTRIYKGTADIMISFATSYHGDASPFDGPQGTLAHAFAPSLGIGGDAHFDDDDALNSLLQIVTLFGHSLGLSHSDVPGALMFPTYSFTDPDRFSLSSDDIRGIQSLYGKHMVFKIPTTPKACDPNLILDAATTLRGETMFFKDGIQCKINFSYSKVSSQTIWECWNHNHPYNLYISAQKNSYCSLSLFTGKQVWAFNGSNLERGYPKTLSSFGLSSLVRKVSAAVYDKNSGKTLLFVDKVYYSYDERAKKMDRGYPQQVESGFPGLTGKVTAAHMSNGSFTFMHGGRAPTGRRAKSTFLCVLHFMYLCNTYSSLKYI
uniref:Peptidase metallopeptidase domain-containing protein n=1 Tax=Sinocyclocheilus rhinocerous TaxID=307959 RepID=A0A673LES9_9TELE